MQAITTYTTQSLDLHLYPFEMTIKCGCDVYSFSKKTLEEDFIHFATLFPEGHNELDPKYSRGWKVLFTHWKDCYHWSYDDLQEFHQLLFCVLKAGSKRWLDALKGYRFYCLSPEYSKVSGVLKEFQKECQNISTSFNCNDLLQGLNESFVQEILKQNFSPNEYEIFQILVFHGKQVRALYLPAISDALIPWFRVFFQTYRVLVPL